MSRSVHTKAGNIDPTNPTGSKNVSDWCKYSKDCSDYGAQCNFCKNNLKSQKKSYFDMIDITC